MVLRWFKAPVEHYLRLTFHKPTEPVSPHAEVWRTKAHEWMDTLEDEDREFLRQIFSVNEFDMREILSNLPGAENEKWRRLILLEKDYARFSGLL